MASSTTVTIQDKLVKFDNLLQGLELLTEEIRTRKELVLTDESLQTMFEEAINKDDNIRQLAAHIVSRMGNTTIVNAVTRQVKAEIEKHIDSYIATQLAEPNIEARIEKLIQNRAAGISAAPVQPAEKTLEELTYDTVEDIAARFRILAEQVATADVA